MTEFSIHVCIEAHGVCQTIKGCMSLKGGICRHDAPMHERRRIGMMLEYGIGELLARCISGKGPFLKEITHVSPVDFSTTYRQ